MRRTITALLSIALAAACGGSGKRAPREPPATLAALADDPTESGGRRAAVGSYPGELRAVRRGPCGIPISVSIEALMTDQGIAQLQERLVARGLLRPAAFRRGALDRATLSAVLALQRELALPEVGLPTYATIAALGMAPAEVFETGEPTCRGDRGGPT